MPLQPLDKIVLHKTVIGIACPTCGGADFDRGPQIASTFLQRVRVLLGPKATAYDCKSCGGRFMLYANGKSKAYEMV
jgi:predicted RNA-binding Zn-ribbon protein involved in translation (DUF1610 family)